MDYLLLQILINLDIAFHVDSVVGIHRVSWADIIKPNATISKTEESIRNNKIWRPLDYYSWFWKNCFDINPNTGLNVDALADIGPRTRNDIHCSGRGFATFE